MPHAAPLDEEDDDPTIAGSGAAAAAAQDLAGKKGNILPLWGNANTLNLNPLILTNIQNSPYFKVQCFSLKTYHEVVDEIYYKVAHLEPWERGDWKYLLPDSIVIYKIIALQVRARPPVRRACVAASVAWAPAASSPQPTASFSSWAHSNSPVNRSPA